MPCLRQMSDIVSPLARSRSASRSNRATSSAFLRLLMGPSWAYFTRRLPFRLDQFLGGRSGAIVAPNPTRGAAAPRRDFGQDDPNVLGCHASSRLQRQAFTSIFIN